MERFSGRAALVTGAASGIGEAVSKKLASFGMTVYGCDRDSEGLKRVELEIEATARNSAAEKSPPTAESTETPAAASSDQDATGMLKVVGRLIPLVCDLRNEEEISKMFQTIKEKSGCVAVCVMSAGVGHKAPLLEGESSMFRSMFEVNVLSTVLCAQACVKLMRERGVDDGHLVIINSGAGHSVRVGRPDYADFNFYNATKFALTAITEGLRFELRLAKSKTRISQISPGLVETNFTHSMYPDQGHIIDMLYQCVQTLKPNDVADAVIHVLRQPAHVQVHDIRLDTIGPDRPHDWEKRVAAAQAKAV